ncbi:MAG: threonine--tRNA ligase [Candidatus Bathyarchaeota archaeon]|nr:threonine--tRNA ligase [Candidatus Bathyarchaeota archaeon]MDH5494467.1 threonine--tRNA ligase [Candidatus Bathyarchaeota archaeon]
MRILQLHSNYIKYKPIQKEIDLAEEAEKKERRIEEVVVLFTAIEEGDNKTAAKQAVEEVQDFLEKLKVNKILIYPYAHLSSELAKPAVALKVIKAMEKYAKEKRIETFRAPFGWNKQFTISIKGHPLAEQSRVIQPGEVKIEERISEALKAEEKMKSSWHILQPDGKLVPIEKFDFTRHEDLEKFAKYEISKMQASQQAPPHIRLMKRLELVDYEPGSDPGNLRWYPKGRLVKSLIEQFVTRTMAEYGAMEVETPIMYDFHHPSLSDYLDRFPARQYTLKSEDKDLFLRFAACFGQFLMLHDAQFSYRQLPLRIYELTRYSFRREKSGEITGLRRQRAFTMPDCHALCLDLEQAKKEFVVRFKLCMKVLKGFELGKEDYELAIRFTKDFYEENKDFIVSLAKLFAKPVLIEMFKEKAFYWILKWEFNFVDNQNKASALSTDQIDVENACRYDITYIDEKGERQHPLILHCSPSGGIERCVYMMLEKAYREQQKGKAPILPLWLSPTQVRVIPVSDKFMKDAENIAEKIAKYEIRVDFDDRSLTLQRKVREAETEWVNYVIVVGQKEIDSRILPVRDRVAGKIRKMKLQELVDNILKEKRGKPFKPLPLPKKLSQRPQFYG